MFAILIVGALSVFVLSAWAAVAYGVRRHSQPRRPNLMVIEGGRTFRH